MKVTPLGALLLPFLLAGVPQAAMAADGIYTSVELGQASFSGFVSGSDTAYRIGVGYQFNHYVGVEGGYADFGSVTSSSGLHLCSDPGIPCVPVSAYAKAKGYFLEATGTLPLGSNWSLYGRAGAFAASVEAQYAAGLSAINSSNNTALIYGVGIGWSPSDRFGLHLGWDDYGSLGESAAATGKVSVKTVNLGFTYSF